MAAKRFKGVVMTNKMTNTVVVALNRLVPHPRYGKLLKATTRLQADTNGTSYNLGDVVEIEETKPMSKNKHFKVLGKAKGENNGTA